MLPIELSWLGFMDQTDVKKDEVYFKNETANLWNFFSDGTYLLLQRFESDISKNTHTRTHTHTHAPAPAHAHTNICIHV